jgi:hypothetical protein
MPFCFARVVRLTPSRIACQKVVKRSKPLGTSRCSSSESCSCSALEALLAPSELIFKGSKSMLFCRRRSSYLRSRSSKMRSVLIGNLRRRLRGSCVAGTHCACDLRQLAHGNFRSHFTLRCWHKTHASTRWCFGGGCNDDVARASNEVVARPSIRVIVVSDTNELSRGLQRCEYHGTCRKRYRCAF